MLIFFLKKKDLPLRLTFTTQIGFVTKTVAEPAIAPAIMDSMTDIGRSIFSKTAFIDS